MPLDRRHDALPADAARQGCQQSARLSGGGHPRHGPRHRRAAAAEGLAGEDAMRTARQAGKPRKRDRRAVVHHLLSTLIRQVACGPNASPAVPGPDSADLDTRARQIVAWLAPRLGQSAGWGHQGAGRHRRHHDRRSASANGRIPPLSTCWRDARADRRLGEHAARQRPGVVGAYRLLDRRVHPIVRGNDARPHPHPDRRHGRPVANWATDPPSIVRVAERPEWLLDGWEQICLIWNHAQDNSARRVALVEIADHIPTMPKELNEWGGGRAKMNDVFAEHVASASMKTGAPALPCSI